MTVFIVPTGATPGLLDSTTLITLDAICNVGSLAGVRDGSVSAWVQVCITPVGDVTPDAWGRFLHAVVEFVQPAEWRGKRRRQVPGLSTSEEPGTLQVECDPGWFWIGSWARILATGGTAGNKYDITMTVATMQQEADARLAAGDDPPFYQVDVFEPACKFRLTAMSMAGANDPVVSLPGIAKHHSRFKLVEGSATWGGVPVRGKKSLPLNAPITTGTDTIYRTLGRV